MSIEVPRSVREADWQRPSERLRAGRASAGRGRSAADLWSPPSTPARPPVAAPPTSEPRARAQPRPGRNGARGAAPRLTHLPTLDGLRGLAVLAVVLYHFSPGVAPGGFLGVDLFFVLSGFLITSLLVSEREGTAAINLAAFWGRRARRLLPALFLLLAAVGAYALLIANPVDGRRLAQDGLAAFTYVANWHFIGSGQGYFQLFTQQAPSPLRHVWSLAIEEQFYLVWPIIVLLVGKLVSGRIQRHRRQRRRLRHALFATCVVLGAASFLRMVTLYKPGGDPNRVYYGTDTRAFIILVGAALGALSVGDAVIARRWPRRFLIVLGCLSLLTLAAAFASVTAGATWLFEGGYGVVAVLMVIVLAAAVQPGLNPLARLLTFRPLVGLGLISYGVYLWHWPFTVWLTAANTGVDGPLLFALRTAVTLAVALASYVLVEQPIRRGRLPRLRLSNPGVAPAAFVTAVAAALLVPALALPSAANPTVTAGATAGTAAATAAYAAAPRCDQSPAPPSVAANRRIRVQLVGNSIAREAYLCLRTILGTRGATLQGLAPAGFLLCEEVPAVERAVRDPATRPSAGIFFALVGVITDPGCGPHATWRTPVDRLIRLWKSVGAHVYLVPSVPAVFGDAGVVRRVVGGSIEDATTIESAYYRALAARDPTHITALDAGMYLHDASNRYLWQMPCLPHEVGCLPNHTIGVRWPIDGFHFCSVAGAFGLGSCPAPSSGGERRVAAAIATGLLPSLATLTGRALG